MPSRATKAEHVGMQMYEVSVLANRELTPHLRRITVCCPELRQFADDGPDQRFKLLLPRPGQSRPIMPDDGPNWYQSWLAMPADERPVMRTYTVRAARPDEGELDIDMLVHGDIGPGSSWAMRAEPGDHAGLFAAYAEYDPDPAARQLIAGDHSALPAIAAICERLSPSAVAHVLIEVPGPQERLDLAHPDGVRVDWLDARNAAPGAALLDALPGAAAAVDPQYAWVAADQETTAAMRRHLVRERGLEPERVMFMGYWRTDGAIDDD